MDPLAYELVASGYMSTVNVAEAVGKSVGWPEADRRRILALLASLDRVENFTASQARVAGDLVPLTQRAGLSLGDRACLALALELGGEVYTTDRAWTRVDPGCKVNLLR